MRLRARHVNVCVGIALAIVAGAALAPVVAEEVSKPAVTKPAPIDRNGVLILVRSTLSALDQANKTGNYTVFRDLAAPSLAAANNAARLGDIFASQRRDHLDLAGVLVLDPQLTVLPELDEAGRMRLAGFFPSVPTQVNFKLQYEPIGGQWRIGEIGVYVAPSGPVPPEPPATPLASKTPPPPPKPVPTVKVQAPKKPPAKDVAPKE